MNKFILVGKINESPKIKENKEKEKAIFYKEFLQALKDENVEIRK